MTSTTSLLAKVAFLYREIAARREDAGSVADVTARLEACGAIEACAEQVLNTLVQ